MAKIYQNRGGTLTPILDTDKFVSVENVNQTILGNKTFTGSVVVPDQTVGNYSSNAANTKFVQDTVTNLISCREETYTAPAGGIPENTNITIPSSQKYIVGSKMLEVYYNGLIEYRGDQYDEVGTVNTESGTITIKHAMEEGDKLVFRINGLCDADSVSDAVHITGTETITGTKTFTVSPNVPTVTDISDSSTKIASTKFVHDLVDGFVTCVDEVLDITTAQASGSLVTLPQGLQYIVGSNALMVSYNGAVCHHGEQFNEYGTTGQLSNQIEILFDLSVGDQLGFRIQGLNRIDDFTDVVHQSGAETITGTKTFNVSPVLPEMAMSTNDRTAASTEFVHDMVDGFMMCYDEVLTVATPVVSGGNITLPAGMQYVVGSHMLMMSYNGTVCHIGEQFNEVGTTGQNSSTIQVLFDLRVGDKLGFRLHGISEAVQIPYDVVHTSGSETISGVKSFNSSPVVPTPSLGDYSNNVVTSKWVKDVSTAAVYVSPDGDDSNSGMTAAESVRTISQAIEIGKNLPSSGGSDIFIEVAAGSYTENNKLNIHEARICLNINGNTTFNGNISISKYGLLKILGESYDLVVNGSITIDHFSSAYFQPSWTQNGALYLYDGSRAFFCSDTTISSDSTNGDYTLLISTSSVVLIQNTKSFNIYSTSTASSIFISNKSYLNARNIDLHPTNVSGFTLNISNHSTLDCTRVRLLDTSAGGGINVENNSTFIARYSITINKIITGTSCRVLCGAFILGSGEASTIQGPTNNSKTTFDVTNSYIYIGGDLNIESNSSNSIVCYFNHCTHMQHSGTLSIKTNVQSRILLYVTGCSSVQSYGPTIFNGTTPSSNGFTVACEHNGSVLLKKNDISGTVTGGRRFVVNTGGEIYVGGMGLQAIPGSLDGTITSTSYGYYG